MLDHLRADLRSAVRRLRSSPGYALVSVITLGLGIGASTAIFSAVDGVLLKSLPYRDPSSLVQLWESSTPRNFTNFPSLRPTSRTGGSRPDRSPDSPLLDHAARSSRRKW
jgi:hypothetical protein